jgi:lysophospholipase L1-like esterase
MADTPTDPRRRRGLRALAALVGLVVAAAAAEIALRITHWGVWAPRTDDYHLLARTGQTAFFFDPGKPTSQTWDHDPYGRLPPGATMTYALNSKGMRGAEPEEGRPKILFVGDSFTFGEGVRAEDTFPERVERALAGRLSFSPQSINAGVPGYGSQQEAERLPEFLADFKPRAVVLVYVPNDPIPLDDAVKRGDDLLRRGDEEAPTLYLVRLLAGVFSRASSDRATEEWYFSYYFGERREQWEKTQRDLKVMKERTVQAGATFGVVYFPLLHRLAERPFKKIDDAVAAYCKSIGAPFLDLSDALAREPDQALWVHPTDHHPDARANEIAAEAMTPFVESLLK